MKFTHLCTAPKPGHYPHLKILLPLFCQSWTKLFPELSITFCLVTDEEFDPHCQNCHIIRLPTIPNISLEQQRLLLTILAPAFTSSPTEGILLTDLDKLPLRVDYYQQSAILRDISTGLVSYRSNFLGQQQTLTSYHIASLGVWQSLLEINDNISYESRVTEILGNGKLDPIKLRQLLYKMISKLDKEWIQLNDQICNFNRLERPIITQSIEQLRESDKYTDLSLSHFLEKSVSQKPHVNCKQIAHLSHILGEKLDSSNKQNTETPKKYQKKHLISIKPISKEGYRATLSPPSPREEDHGEALGSPCIYDKIYIINLEARKDRYYHMLKELERVNLNNFEFFAAIKPTYEDVINWHPEYCQYMSRRLGKSFNKYQIGALGCLSSHIAIMQQALEKGYDRILILEDDTKFKQPLTELFGHMNEINNEFDILYLTINNMRQTPKASEHFYRVKKGLTTSAYIITRKMMLKVIELLPGYGKEIDVFYAEKIQPKYKCYVYKPYLTTQISSQSDIMQKQVSYRLR